jgi:hypothetical protein
MPCSGLMWKDKTCASSRPTTPARKNGKRISRQGDPNEMHGLRRSYAPYYH